MDATQKRQLLQAIMRSYRYWGWVMMVISVITDILEINRWKQDKTLADRLQILRTQQNILMALMLTIHTLALIKLKVAPLCIFSHFLKFCYAHPYEHFLVGCSYEPMSYKEITIKMIPSFGSRSILCIIMILWNLQYNFLAHRRNQKMKDQKEELDTILNKMCQSMILVKDGKVIFTNEKYRQLVKINQKSFGLTIQNPRVELDDILEIEFLKQYQTKK